MRLNTRKCDKITLLVGSNPLPNYIAAMALRPSCLTLLHTRETEELKDRLAEVLEDKLGDIEIKSVYIENATKAKYVEKAYEEVPEGSHLNYTGGTKVMAVHAYRAFIQRGESPENASYVDERAGKIRYDRGVPIELKDVDLKLDLDVILRLHRITRCTHTPREGKPTLKDASEIAIKTLENPDLAATLYDIGAGLKKKKITKATKEPYRPADQDLRLSQEVIPVEGWTNDLLEDWYKFLGGGWLEDWVAETVKGIIDEPISVNVCCERESGLEFQIDDAHVIGHRMYVISCTGHTKLALCKSKMFEVALRSRQMGGDLTRCALVCLLHGENEKGLYIKQLQDGIEDLWNAPNTPVAFGLEDLRGWAGSKETSGNTFNLEQWLKL